MHSCSCGTELILDCINVGSRVLQPSYTVDPLTHTPAGTDFSMMRLHSVEAVNGKTERSCVKVEASITAPE